MGAKKRPLSPRQRMINLMYIVLMAMLALNVSSDVLQGFTLIEESLQRTALNAGKENETVYKHLKDQYLKNPQKVKHWYDLATIIKAKSDSLYQLAQKLKQDIKLKADGDEEKQGALINKDDKESSNFVMLSESNKQGEKLRIAIENYRKTILSYIPDTLQRKLIADNLSTDFPKKQNSLSQTWEEYTFGEMPAAATIAMLTKLQNDIRYAEGQALRTLGANIDLKDVRVNALSAFVIPNSQVVMRGSKFSARIIMAAVDTTARPEIYVNNAPLRSKDGIYEITTTQTGDFTLNGFIKLLNGQGEEIRRTFTQKYTVIAPTATVSADLMNVFYAGYPNPISISVPGVPVNTITATMQGGSLQKKADGKFIALPSQPGTNAIISVFANIEGKSQEMGKFTFKVRRLPDPTAFITLQTPQGEQQYKGGGQRIPKGSLLNVEGVEAAIDDGMLNIPFKVVSFETIFFDNMGNAVPEVSAQAKFSARQKDIFRRLTPGKRFFISRIKAIGPDGVERTLNQSLDVIVQ